MELSWFMAEKYGLDYEIPGRATSDCRKSRQRLLTNALTRTQGVGKVASIYLLHRIDQLSPPAPPPEGQVFPLLCCVGDSGTDLNWAFAVPKAAATGSSAVVRKNRLVVAALRALGFRLDPNNDAAGGDLNAFDFLYLPDAHFHIS